MFDVKCDHLHKGNHHGPRSLPLMDQSTQVNFPTLVKYPRKRLQRHNTTADLRTSSTRGIRTTSSWINNTSLPSVIPQLRLSTPPRSLNLSTETFQRSKLSYNSPDSPASRFSYPASSGELTFSVISRDRTPPHSSNSSVVMNGYTHKHSYPQQTQNKVISSHVGANSQHFLQVPPTPYHTSEGINTSGGCRCFYDGDPNDKTKIPSATPEGLSWRRLHMSRAKLKATSTTSELLSGFAMVAMVELQINEDTAVPEWLFVMFSVCTTVLVAVHIFALMISTYILPNIDAISKLDVCELVTESPHERMKGFIELAWAFSTVLGLFLFLVEVAILCWVKFWDYSFTAAIAATVIVIPVLVIFVLFAVHFYHSLVVHRCDTSISDMQKLEDMKKHLDEVTSPV
ncbi:hypothetical protein ILUMI_23296 [Ignelater luminosus]|uniref:Calcium release-activated calcium channel protein 1 n=1 Tax=Ignelater luminosus TaxID=2038154 RepID=A0A8K0CB08_IGNLU|nr:hypothetical protein ILUMI_23296 [Ignelater luminosus]